jgi:hypothetical protein
VSTAIIDHRSVINCGFVTCEEMVHRAFPAACDFVHRVPAYRLTFVPDARVWETIR